jgi:diguanylate cyclase (GGDEF)-like protein
MNALIANETFQDAALMARIGSIADQLLKDLPAGMERREQALLERALRYAAETEQRMADQRRRIAELENLSFSDPLTDLPNRRGFETQLGQALARARRYGEIGLIAYCDLDNLKEVNDSLGHAAGDKLVKCVARTLARSIREIDSVGRLGGDEFGLLMVNTSWKDGTKRMRTLQWALDSAGMVHQGKDVPLRVSIGYEPYGPNDTVEDLIHRADMAMYYNKRRRQAGFVRSAAE